MFSPFDRFIFDDIIDIQTQVQLFFVRQFGLHLIICSYNLVDALLCDRK